MSKFEFKKAERKKIWTKISLSGCAGSGKTWTALALATGMKNALEQESNETVRILMGNTEKSRGRYYANEFNYDICDIDNYTPEEYIELINAAVEAGYKILVLDTITPEWEECCRQQSLAGGDWKAWKNITPRHQAFLDAIISSPIHIIANSRAKETYEVDKDANGKVSIKKLGLGENQRSGLSYEFTCSFMLDQQHVATATKDNTKLFETVPRALTVTDGEKIIKWADSSSTPEESEFKPIATAAQRAEVENEFETKKNKIKEIALALQAAGQLNKYNEVVSTYLGEGMKVSETTVVDLPRLDKILTMLSDIKY